jgi:hypothetical protein
MGSIRDEGTEGVLNGMKGGFWWLAFKRIAEERPTHAHVELPGESPFLQSLYS